MLDIGCGSGLKLMKYFSCVPTIGLDLAPTVDWLKRRYRHRKWFVPAEPITGYGLLLCSDVIEHIQEPDKLLDFIEACRPKIIILSTPERNALVALGHGHSHDGPPKNLHHVREWTDSELSEYLRFRFNVIKQTVIADTQIVEMCSR